MYPFPFRNVTCDMFLQLGIMEVLILCVYDTGYIENKIVLKFHLDLATFLLVKF